MVGCVRRERLEPGMRRNKEKERRTFSCVRRKEAALEKRRCLG
jgi:hypothetical protein